MKSVPAGGNDYIMEPSISRYGATIYIAYVFCQNVFYIWIIYSRLHVAGHSQVTAAPNRRETPAQCWPNVSRR